MCSAPTPPSPLSRRWPRWARGARSGSASRGGSEPPAVWAAEGWPAPARAALARLSQHGLRWCAVLRGGSLTIHGFDAPPPEAWVRLGSVSKLVVGRVTQALIADGRMALPDPLGRHCRRPLPPDVAALPLSALATHATGLGDALEDPAFRKRVNRDVAAPVPLDAVLEASLARPRGAARYANVNAILLALACEGAAGRPFAALLHDVLDDGFALAGPLPHPQARGWRWGRAPGRIEYGHALHEATEYDPSWSWAAGAVAARLDALELLGPRVLAPLAAEPPAPYALLARRSDGWTWHDGDVPSFSAWAGRRDADGTMLAVVAGLSWTPGAGNPAAMLVDAFRAAPD